MNNEPAEREPDRSSGQDWATYERQRLQETALTLARWQGITESQITENTRRLDGINGSLEHTEKGIGEIKIELSVLRTKVALGSAMGGLIGAGAVTLILTLVQ